MKTRLTVPTAKGGPAGGGVGTLVGGTLVGGWIPRGPDADGPALRENIEQPTVTSAMQTSIGTRRARFTLALYRKNLRGSTVPIRHTSRGRSAGNLTAYLRL